MSRALHSLAALLVAICSTACSADDPDPTPAGTIPRNLLLVTLDTTRADRIGCYGHAGASTPVIDGLARRGVLFERCFSPAPITLPSHATILTGLEPYSHGARNNGTHRLPDEVSTVAEQLRARGFAAGAVISAFVLDSRFGLDQGFDSYDDDLSAGVGGGVSGYRETDAANAVARARAWLAQRGDERWFLWLHLFDPHADYAPPAPYAARFAAQPYDGEIAYADAQLGELLDGIDALASTLVVVTADHGESLGEHGERTHGVFVYDATTHVPLVLSHPSLAQGTRVDALVGSADVAPTLLELLDVAPGGALDGRSLAGLARGADEAFEPRAAYSEAMMPLYNYGWSDLRALRDADHRYVRAPRSELYALADDAREERDVAGARPGLLDDYRARLERRLPAVEADASAGAAGELDPELRRQLADLGYTFDDERDDAGVARPDPKDRIDALERQREGDALVAAGRLPEAEAVYAELVAQNPRSVPHRNLLSDLLVRADRDSDALAIELGTLELPGAQAVNFVRAAELSRALGLEGWPAHLAAAKRREPLAPAPWVREADLVHLPGDPQAALAAYEQALALDPRCAPAWIGVARVAAMQRDLPRALDAARHATEADPERVEAWFQLGTLSAASGDQRAARVALERGRALDGAHLDTRLALAMICAGLGDLPAADVELRRALELDPAAVERAAAAKPALRELLRRAR